MSANQRLAVRGAGILPAPRTAEMAILRWIAITDLEAGSARSLLTLTNPSTY